MTEQHWHVTFSSDIHGFGIPCFFVTWKLALQVIKLVRKTAVRFAINKIFLITDTEMHIILHTVTV